MGVTYDDLPDHEGYARADHHGNIACCSCGWTGGTFRADEAGREAAIGDSDDRQAAVLLESAVPAAIADMVAETRRALRQLQQDRPVAGDNALRELHAWATSALTRPAPQTERQRLGAPTGRDLSL